MTARYSRRKAIEGNACIAAEGLVGNGRVLDLSVPGCLLETGLHLKLGQCLRLRLMYAGSKPLTVTLGVVRWLNGRHVGIEFIRMSDEDQASLRRQVGFLEPQHTVSWSEPIMWTGIARA
jgi:hypothetical protein